MSTHQHVCPSVQKFCDKGGKVGAFVSYRHTSSSLNNCNNWLPFLWRCRQLINEHLEIKLCCLNCKYTVIAPVIEFSTRPNAQITKNAFPEKYSPQRPWKGHYYLFANTCTMTLWEQFSCLNSVMSDIWSHNIPIRVDIKFHFFVLKWWKIPIPDGMGTCPPGLSSSLLILMTQY